MGVGTGVGNGEGTEETDGAGEGFIVSAVTAVAVTPDRVVEPAFAAIAALSSPLLSAVATALSRLPKGSFPLLVAALSMLTVMPIETPEVNRRTV